MTSMTMTNGILRNRLAPNNQCKLVTTDKINLWIRIKLYYLGLHRKICSLIDCCITHIFQGCITGIGAIIWLPLCQWCNPEGYGYHRPVPNPNQTMCSFLGLHWKSCLSPTLRGPSPFDPQSTLSPPSHSIGKRKCLDWNQLRFRFLSGRWYVISGNSQRYKIRNWKTNRV